MSTLYLHAGAIPATRTDLSVIEPPAPTDTWHPLSHYDFATSIIDTLHFMGATITSENYGIKEGDTGADEFFGLIEFEHEKLDIPDGTSLGLGFRNSWTKRFPAGGILSKKTLVCDNQAFAGTDAFQFKRKNTPGLARELPSITASAMMNFLRTADSYLRESAALDRHYLDQQYGNDEGIILDHVCCQLAQEEAITWSNVRKVRNEVLRIDGPGGLFPRNGRGITFGDVMQGITEVEKLSLNPLSTPTRMSTAHRVLMDMIDYTTAEIA